MLLKNHHCFQQVYGGGWEGCFGVPPSPYLKPYPLPRFFNIYNAHSKNSMFSKVKV
jgi:hypothetical protein